MANLKQFGMRYRQLFGKTSKQDPHDESSINAKLLIRAGFIRKEVAGVYNFLPLGLRVLNKISEIIRDEMNAAGAQELFLSALQNKENWQKTGRWVSFDVLFKVKSQWKNEYALGPTHEEVLIPIVRDIVDSYRDLPVYVYQIQTKFRDEARAKAGLLRGREFLMKDLYSFHRDEEEMFKYYEKMKKSYHQVFLRVGLEAIETKAGGGTFSKESHEYQVICESGEDEIIYCPGGDYSENVEIATAREGQQCELGHGPLKKVKTIEVGNIFPLRDKYSQLLDLKFKDRDGSEKFVMMGCYGIGVSRLMGAIVEVKHDERGIVWPKSVSPFESNLVHVEDKGTEAWAKEAYEKLTSSGVDVLWDDREDVSAGEKFADADLIGIPFRLVISKKVGKGKVELKQRDSKDIKVLNFQEAINFIKS